MLVFPLQKFYYLGLKNYKLTPEGKPLALEFNGTPLASGGQSVDNSHTILPIGSPSSNTWTWIGLHL